VRPIAAIEVPEHGGEINAGGIDQLFIGKIEGGADGQKLSTHGPDLGIHLPGIRQSLDEVGKQQDIRIQCQHPLTAAHSDGLILRRGKPYVLVVVDHPAAVHELLQDIRRAIGRGIVDDDDFISRRDVLLRTLRQQGVLTLEVDPARLSSAIVNQYLSAKERSLI